MSTPRVWNNTMPPAGSGFIALRQGVGKAISVAYVHARIVLVHGVEDADSAFPIDNWFDIDSPRQWLPLLDFDLYIVPLDEKDPA